MKNLKSKLIITALIVLSGLFVFGTADVQKEVTAMFLGSVGSVSLLTIIFFIAGMLVETKMKDRVKPYAVVFGLLIMWIVIFTVLRLVVKF